MWPNYRRLHLLNPPPPPHMHLSGCNATFLRVCVQSIGVDCSCLVIDSIHLANWFTMSSTDTITCATSVFKVNRALSEPHNPTQLLTITKFTGIFAAAPFFTLRQRLWTICRCHALYLSNHIIHLIAQFHLSIWQLHCLCKSTDTFDNECARGGGRQFVGKLITGTLRQQGTHTKNGEQVGIVKGGTILFVCVYRIHIP